MKNIIIIGCVGESSLKTIRHALENKDVELNVVSEIPDSFKPESIEYKKAYDIPEITKIYKCSNPGSKFIDKPKRNYKR